MVPIVDTHGHLPPFWPERSLFFANLLALFFGNEAETELLGREVGGVDSYGGRLVPVLDILFKGRPNVLVLEREPDPALCRHFREALHLSLPELRTLPHRDYAALGHLLQENDGDAADRILGDLARSGPELIDGYVTDATLLAIARHTGRRTVSSGEGSRLGNNKYLLHRHLQEAGLPVFDTVLAETPEGVPAALGELQRRGYRQAVAKSQVGASGIGLLKLPTGGAIPEPLPDLFFFEGPCLVQGWLEPGQRDFLEIHSPSVQMFLGSDRVYLYDMTEQILSRESIHEGNVSPPPLFRTRPGLREEMIRQAGVAGSWLHFQGYRGTASADFLIGDRSGGAPPEVYVCELNARVTGATYPSVLARHFLPGGAWLMRNLKLAQPLPGHALLDILRQHGDLFDLSKPGGVIPVNFNLDDDNRVTKGQFLCLASTEADCRRLLFHAQTGLPLEWHFTRD